MARHSEYIIVGPPTEADGSMSAEVHKSLSVRRETKHATNLRSLYRSSASSAQDEHTEMPSGSSTVTPTTAHLPLTPPAAEEEVASEGNEDDPTSDDVKNPSIPATPVNQSPPTPEDTPPRTDLKMPVRPFLTMQPSMASTRAESFTTAREHPMSDDESEASYSLAQRFHPKTISPPPHLVNGIHHRPSPLAHVQPMESLQTENGTDRVPSWAMMPPPDEVDLNATQQNQINDVVPRSRIQAERAQNLEMQSAGDSEQRNWTEQDFEGQVKTPREHESTYITTSQTRPRRDVSLRERLEDAKQIRTSPSTDKFASIIGWNNSVPTTIENHDRRWSGVSTASTVEAYVIESPSTQLQKRGTLRHVNKNYALRSVSSPIPNSNRTSFQSSSDSPHRLVHKKAKLSNQNRWSDGSDFSRSFSVSSSSAFTKPEIIKVAVIPERKSSISSSAESSSRHSRSKSGGSEPVSTVQQAESPISQRKRTMSSSTDKSRDRRYPPQVPQRASSGSAFTSRETSRANSITSEHFTVQRKQAERDLRTTLERMESERILSGTSSTPTTKNSLDMPSTNRILVMEPQQPTPPTMSNVGSRGVSDRNSIPTNGIVPGTAEWAELRPPTIFGTPFSVHSFLTCSPEIVEAKAINLFPHNNDSLQLIEPNVLTESQAVRELRQQRDAQTTALPMLDTDMSRIGHINRESDQVDSPLRNPRNAPEPPQPQVNPETPAKQGGNSTVGRAISSSNKRFDSTKKRPIFNNRSRSDSFVKTLTRTFSARKAKNPREDQYLDSNSYPTWRPGAFWDDEDARRARQQEGLDFENEPAGAWQNRGFHNSLGSPQDRPNISGPRKLLRRLSERSRNYYRPSPPQSLVKRSSMSSLDRFRGTRQIQSSPTTGRSLQFGKLRDLQDRVLSVRSRKEEERAEKRRETLRKSIGPNVTPRGDSRFPAGMTEDEMDSAAEIIVRKRGLRM